MHYGTLDAYCMIPSIEKLIEKANQLEKPVKFSDYVKLFDMDEQEKEKAEKEKGQKPDKKKKYHNKKGNNSNQQNGNA